MNRFGAPQHPAVVVAAIVLAELAAPAATAEAGFRQIDVDVTPIATFDPASTNAVFGDLEFRGGLVIASPDDNFGAFSGLDFTPDGSLIAVADTGLWFTARPLVDDDGGLTGIDDARLAPILDGNGRPLTSKRTGDAEALRVAVRNGRLEALVSFEQKNDVRRFVAAPDFASATSREVQLPKSVDGLGRNTGLEALAIAPADGPLAGAILLVAEHSLDENGNHRGWIVGGPRKGAFALVRSDGFDVTDAVFLPDGDLLVLERRFSLLSGAAMRIRRVAAADLLPGETVDGRVLIEAGMRHQIDNMEGMAVRPGKNSETQIMLISDDNRNAFQRTILLQFALPADPLPTPRMRVDVGQ